jgi:two-component system response regulator NreC
LTEISKLKPDVVLMDISLPDLSGIEATREIKRLWPEIAVVALTIHEDEEYFFKMLDAGASGYVPKRAAPEELLTAIHAANSGDVYLYPSLAKLLVKDYILDQGLAEKEKSIDDLTPRQKEVLIQLGEGGTNLEIAARLNISPNTVARHRENIMHKLNLHSRTELVKYAIRKGYIEL